MKFFLNFAVTEFARKTGDLRGLSTTDIRLIALAYTLERELVGTDHLRSVPTKKVIVTNKSVSCILHFVLLKNRKLINLCLQV